MRLRHHINLIIVAIVALQTPSLRADSPSAAKPEEKQPVKVCIVSGEHLQAGEIVTYIYKKPGCPDRVLRLCCHKCVARFKNDPDRYLKKLDELESGGQHADKTGK